MSALLMKLLVNAGITLAHASIRKYRAEARSNDGRFRITCYNHVRDMPLLFEGDVQYMHYMEEFKRLGRSDRSYSDLSLLWEASLYHQHAAY